VEINHKSGFANNLLIIKTKNEYEFFSLKKNNLNKESKHGDRWQMSGVGGIEMKR